MPGKGSPKRITSFAILASSVASAATRTSERILNEFARGVLIRLNVANVAGGGSFTPSIRVYMADGTAVTYWTAAAAVVGNGNTLYLLSNGNHTNIGALTEVEDIPLPLGHWDVVLTRNAGNADTLVDATYVK